MGLHVQLLLCAVVDYVFMLIASLVLERLLQYAFARADFLVKPFASLKWLEHLVANFWREGLFMLSFSFLASS